MRNRYLHKCKVSLEHINNKEQVKLVAHTYILILRNLGQEDHKIKACLGYRVSPKTKVKTN